MKIIVAMLMLALMASMFAPQVYAQEASDELVVSEQDQAYIEWAQQLWDSFELQTGIVELNKANATLNIPGSFYFLNSSDSQKVLVDVWGNPEGDKPLGMLLPAGSTPFDSDSWAVTIEYEEDGYVSDKHAEEIDYAELLLQLQRDAREESKLRVEQGYEMIELVGWAAHPFYDQAENKLHWAKEYKFGSSATNTLNYNIRVLGRKGVLVLNFIADISQLPEIENQLDTVLALANFEQGSRYADFDPDIDQVAAYGLGALVAGKVIAKTGALAILVVLLKKFWVFLLLGVGALFKVFYRKLKAS